MIDAFDKNMMIIAGENPKSTQEKQLNATDKKKISDEYFKLFFNLSPFGSASLGRAIFSCKFPHFGSYEGPHPLLVK